MVEAGKSFNNAGWYIYKFTSFIISSKFEVIWICDDSLKRNYKNKQTKNTQTQNKTTQKNIYAHKNYFRCIYMFKRGGKALKDSFLDRIIFLLLNSCRKV
jgi:hypothetical protein